LIIKSTDGFDKQLENIFTEDEVKKRLGLSFEETKGNSHKCGEPCTSREIEGKPCEMNTFRNKCHHHR